MSLNVIKGENESDKTAVLELEICPADLSAGGVALARAIAFILTGLTVAELDGESVSGRELDNLRSMQRLAKLIGKSAGIDDDDSAEASEGGAN